MATELPQKTATKCIQSFSKKSGVKRAWWTFEAGGDKAGHEWRWKGLHRFGTIANEGPVQACGKRGGANAAGRASAAGSRCIVLVLQLVVTLMVALMMGMVHCMNIHVDRGPRCMQVHHLAGMVMLGSFHRRLSRIQAGMAGSHCSRGNSLERKYGHQQPKQQCFQVATHFFSLAQSFRQLPGPSWRNYLLQEKPKNRRCDIETEEICSRTR